jgi:LuxR family maltose regulon positive regulatory protein
MTTLINDLSTLTEEDNVDRWLLLTLDDYHLITSQAIHDVLAFLLDHLPGEMRLVLISRTEPSLPLARLRGRGQLVTLDGNDLRFTNDEARLFLNRVMGLDLSQDEVAALAARTEGWIAGLQMAALVMGARSRDHEVGLGRQVDLDRQLAGSRLIMDYLLQEVLQGQPAELQTFLLQTSVLGRLSGPLCDALTGQDNGQATLAELERRNLFLFSLDQEERWYRYHHLFAELLRRRLEQTQPESVPELHRRAGIWQQTNGFMAEAIHHTLAAGDAEEAANLVEKAADPALMRGQFQTVLGWLHLLPEDAIRARPRLGVYQAFLMLLDSQPMVEIEATLRAAEEAATKEGTLAISGETMLFRAVLALLVGDLQRSADLSRHAMTHLPKDTLFIRSLALRNLASVHSMTGDVIAAGETLKEATAMSERTGDKTGLVLSLYSLARANVLQGQLLSARDYLTRAIAVGQDKRGRPLPIVARALSSLADIQREWNKLNEAGRLVQDSIELIRHGLAFWGIGAYVVLAQVRQAEGDTAAAQSAIDAALELAKRFDATDLDDRTVELYQAHLWLQQGNLEAVDLWASRLSGGETRSAPVGVQQSGQIAGWYVVYESEQIHVARLRLAQGKPEETRSALESLRPAAEQHGRMGVVIIIDALLALSWQASGESARALEILIPALALAELEGYIRLFVDEGPAMAELLRLVPQESAVADYACQLLSSFPVAGRTLGERGIPATASQSLQDSLSEREMDVLRLLPTHLTSTEIAAELSVSPNTARFHIKNIYSKLNAHNRAEAVARARQLSLLKEL